MSLMVRITASEVGAKNKEGRSSCRSQNQSLQSWEGSAESHPWPQKENLHFPHPPGPKTLRLWRSPNTVERVHPGETSLISMPSSDPPPHWLSHEEDKTAGVQCGRQGQQAADQRDCEETLWHWWGQSQYPHQAWWPEGLCPAGSALWGSGCVSRIGVI